MRARDLESWGLGYDAGMVDGLDGYDDDGRWRDDYCPSENPFPLDSPDYLEWKDGYEEGFYDATNK